MVTSKTTKPKVSKRKKKDSTDEKLDLINEKLDHIIRLMGGDTCEVPVDTKTGSQDNKED